MFISTLNLFNLSPHAYKLPTSSLIYPVSHLIDPKRAIKRSRRSEKWRYYYSATDNSSWRRAIQDNATDKVPRPGDVGAEARQDGGAMIGAIRNWVLLNCFPFIACKNTYYIQKCLFEGYGFSWTSNKNWVNSSKFLDLPF